MSKYFTEAWEDLEEIAKTASICFLAFCVISIFRNPLCDIAKEVFVDHVFKEPVLGSLADVLGIILIFSSLTFFAIQLAKNKLYPSPKSIIVYTTVLTIYFFIFRNTKEFKYYEIFDKSSIAYLDILYCLLPLFFLRYRAYSEIKTDPNLPSFHEDRFDETSVDLYSRLGIAEELSNLIDNTKNKSAFAIAIIGKWGTGKTVFLSFLEKNLKKNNEIVHFNPWKVTDIKQIYDTFFKSFSNSVSKYDKDASKEIKEYADYLTEIDDENFFSKTLKSTVSTFASDKGLFEKFDAINQSLKVIGKRFVIFIDDLDRLTGKEIVQTLKLIRNTADFRNVFFVVALDYGYATATMSKTNEVAFEEKYLQKIFQFEFVLAPIKKDFIVSQLRKMLAVEKMEINERNQFDIALDRLIFDKNDLVFTLFSDVVFEGDLEAAIDNMRDLTRFVNSFKIVYSHLKNEVELYDLIMLELIKLKSVFAYQLIAERKIIKGSENHAQKHFVFDAEAFDKLFAASDSTYVSIVKRLVSNLFQSPTKLVARSIIYPGSFEIYIYNELFQNISLKDWNYYKDQSAKEFFLKIQEWKLQGKGGSIEQLLSGMNTFKDSQEFEKYLKLFLMLGNNSENRNWLITAFSFFVNKGQLERQYGLNEQQIANLLEKVISDSDISYYSKSEFASFFLMQIIEKNNILFGTKEFWYKQLLSVFREFVKNSDSKANSQSYEIYWNLVDHVDPKDNHLILIPEANEIMKEYLTKVKDDFGRYIIRPYINPPDDKFTFDPWLTQVFGSLDAVITFIESIQSDSELFKIAKAYLPEYKEMKIQNKDYFIVKNKKERDRILELIQQLHAH